MSITYDPEKWTDPLRARDFEPVRKRSSSPVLVSLRELRYFKERQDPGPLPVAVFLEEKPSEEGLPQTVETSKRI